MARLVRMVLAVAADKVADIIDAVGDLAESTSIERMGTGTPQRSEPVSIESDEDLDRLITETNNRERGTRGTVVRRVPAPLTTSSDVDGIIEESRRMVANEAPRNVAPRQVISPRAGRRVLYTPAGTKRQITAALESLRGVDTLRARVYMDLAKHPGSLNADVRKRLTPWLQKTGKSVESVDNVIWQLVSDQLVTKADATMRA